ncbi:hypothetical protein Tco_0047133 [Tanacetum coccineum]
METNDTISSCSDLKEQDMQPMQEKAKESCMVSFGLLHSHLKVLSNKDLKDKQLDKEEFQEIGSMVALKKQDECTRSGNDKDTNDTGIKPVYDEDPTAEVQLTAKCNVFANDQ